MERDGVVGEMLRVPGGEEGDAEGSQAHSSIAKHLSQCLDTSCWVAMETPQLWLMGESSEVSREMGVVEEEGGERKGRKFLVNVRC